MSIYNAVSFIGFFVILGFAWLLSRQRSNVNLKVILWGTISQFALAFIIFWTPIGGEIFLWLNGLILKLLSFAKEGIYFLFGPLGVSPGDVAPDGSKSIGFILAFQSLPTIIFFSALMGLLYYIRLMPLIVRTFARFFVKSMGISGAESLSSASNIFVGIESAFTVRPYIDQMTHSELNTILTAGMATIASSVLGFYASVLHNQFPTIAGHLISASILSAPAAIMVSKLLYPESGKPLTMGKIVEGSLPRASNWVESIINGAQEGVKLVVGIVALLMAFLGLLALLNWFVSLVGLGIGSIIGIKINLSIQTILGYIFYPFGFILGVPPEDLPRVASLLGERAILTELVSYQHLATYIENGLLTNPRSIVITTYALCGFAHIASLAIFVGGISALAPKRKKDIAELGFRSLIGATLACLLTGAVAGIFFKGTTSILFR